MGKPPSNNNNNTSNNFSLPKIPPYKPRRLNSSMDHVGGGTTALSEIQNIKKKPPEITFQKPKQQLDNSNNNTTKTTILKWNETLESLFCLIECEALNIEIPSRIRAVCRSILNTQVSKQSPSEWLIVLEFLNTHINNKSSNTVIKNLNRLHRRATSIMNELDYNSLITSEKEDCMKIWILYTKMQDADERRHTFKFIQSQDHMLQLENNRKLFYNEFASFETRCNNHHKAEHLLKQIDNNINNSNNNRTINLKSTGVIRLTNRNTTTDGSHYSSSNDNKPFNKNLPIQVPKLRSTSMLEDLKRKREEKLKASASDNMITAIKGGSVVGGSGMLKKSRLELQVVVQDDEDDDEDDVSFQIGTTSRTLEKPSFGDKNMTSSKYDDKENYIVGASNSAKFINKIIKLSARVDTKSHTTSSNKQSQMNGLVSELGVFDSNNSCGLKPCIKHKSSLLQKKAGTKNEEQSHSLLLDKELPSKEITSPSRAVASGSSKEKYNKLTKADLGYMLSWDPKSFRKRNSINDTNNQITGETFKSLSSRSTATGSNNSIGARSQSSTESKRSEKEGTTKESTVTKHYKKAKCANDGCEASIPSTTQKQNNDRQRHQQSDDVFDQTVEISKPPPTGDGGAIAVPSSVPTADITIMKSNDDKINQDLLPLVLESNVIRVNNKSYSKLGVIGKGGSCKVYKVLSADGNIYALKKVKLKSNMKKETIDGYANEIQLLKKLKGNSAIIQLQDSIVDLSRQVIFLVMELGEVDLNYVLQKQSKKTAGFNKVTSNNSKRRSHLDINFIRLTWQQMLLAVHSIHEERIIHGDLKPANFLFVKGALKLIDFGIAKAMANDETTNIYRDSTVGTMNYMSPESIQGDSSSNKFKQGRASDVWSLGCILYQMIYGKTPFAHLHQYKKLMAIVDPNHQISYPQVEDGESAVDAIQQCLIRDPLQRAPIISNGNSSSEQDHEQVAGLLDNHHFLHSNNRLPLRRR